MKEDVLLMPTPSMEEVERYLNEWKRNTKLQNYRVQEEVLETLFSRLHKNEELKDVLLKVTVLNSFYSTNIFSVYQVAKHIVSVKDIDEKLKKGDISLIDDIKSVNIAGVTKNFYSFASKYCSHHNKECFPIYDSLVCDVLSHLQRRDNFRENKFTKKSLKNYETFCDVLKRFRSFYKLENISARDLDWYLWMQGKEYFGKRKIKLFEKV